jgi:transporter family-2 protein
LITQRRLEIPLYDTQKNRIPIWVYMAGIFGIFILTGNIVLLPVLGSVLTTMIFILGQMIMALIIICLNTIPLSLLESINIPNSQIHNN